MTSLIAFLVTILIIVTLHEWGHYLAMRLFGVRVLTFSIGFGKPLFGFTNRRGERFVLSAIPLGGYVRALDRRETEVQPGEEQQEFMAKPAWQRVLIYAAGPLMNLILAALIFWALLITQGEAGRVPMLDTPPANTPAALAGVQGEIVSCGSASMKWPLGLRSVTGCCIRLANGVRWRCKSSVVKW